ncbi:Ankyrin repeat-containing protein [Cynara cardunculus var. scolymus]|uniref:RING-type E3 ubiquitin transferase n=1 Tax=Cynara cardunculus var. scolymus TaxID=59895 RepID=A0A118K202_CYNCS|nr:Ankyrin repeat-containing protein [Cynara cardunculus var. scolymus]
MGQGLSCRVQDEHGLFTAVQFGDLELVKTLLERDPSLIQQTTVYDRHSALHIAAANGQIEIVSMLLEDRSVNPDCLNRHKQTPLMLAAMHGKINCVEKLIEARANILMFDSLNGRTCLHYAACYGHSDCLEMILSAARTSHVAASWGFSRFVNIRDGKGATPLHLAARQRRPQCVHLLLDSGALVCASTGGYGRIPYLVALKHKNDACAALLNPSSAEPLVWPSPLKFISELNQDAKALLEQALMEANREREKTILKGTSYSIPSPSHSNSGAIEDDISEVQDCGHQMCAQCTLALCCHNKPNPTTTSLTAPVCPFCRSNIAQLVVAKVKVNSTDQDLDLYSSPKLPKSRKPRNFSEGSSSFKSLSAVPSFGKMVGRGSGRVSADNECIDKP